MRFQRHVAVGTLLALLITASLQGTTSTGAAAPTAASSDLVVWAWGDNMWSQLGDGSTQDRYLPTQLTGLTGVVAIDAGDFNNLALKSDGTVWAWGRNQYGELGDGTTLRRLSPVPVLGLTDAVAVAAGSWFGLALKSDGSVWAWGWNGRGAVGDGTTVQRLTPVPVVGLSAVKAIDAGEGTSYALKADGTVWAWGANWDGQIGDGTLTDRLTPVQVVGLTGVSAIASGGREGLALKSDGTVWSWGTNPVYPILRTSPVQVDGLAGVTAIATKGSHSLALKADGTVWAWGSNQFGELGDGTTVYRHSPVRITGLDEVTAIAAGDYHSLALKSDRTLWSWGHNADGQLGDGTTLQRDVPVLVGGLPRGVAISGGRVHTLALSQLVWPRLVFTNAPITIAANTVSSTLTVQAQNEVGAPVTSEQNNTLAVKLTSDSAGVATFMAGAPGLPPLEKISNNAFCAYIPAGGNSVTFGYKDTAAGTHVLTAIAYTGGTPNRPSCAVPMGTSPGMQNVNVQTGPKSVDLQGAGFGPSAGTVNWNVVDGPSVAITAKCSSSLKTACYKSWSDKKISIVPPLGDLETSVRVDVNDGETNTKRADDRFFFGPFVTDVSPQTGGPSADGGTVVTISGVGFGTTARVQFGGDVVIDTGDPLAKCTSSVQTKCWKSSGDTKIIVQAPTALEAGTTMGNAALVAVMVSNVDLGRFVASYADPVFWYGLSVITAMTWKSGGGSVDIRGAGFGPSAGTVNWNVIGGASVPITAPCSSSLKTACYKNWSDKKVSIVPPSGDLGTSVRVDVNDGETNISKADNTFYYGPFVTGVTPQAGGPLDDGGTVVTISGVGFGTTAKVLFGEATIDTGDPMAKCTPSLQKKCWKSSGDTKIMVQAPTALEAGTTGEDAVSIAVEVGGIDSAIAGYTDNYFYYGKSVITSMTWK